MSNQNFGFYFSCNADGTANDYTIYVESSDDGETVKLGARYKNSQPNTLYEISMDSEDLDVFGHMCLSLSSRMKNV